MRGRGNLDEEKEKTRTEEERNQNELVKQEFFLCQSRKRVLKKHTWC